MKKMKMVKSETGARHVAYVQRFVHLNVYGLSAPEEFYIDVDICMNCGLCAEYCPFDAIKMDHDFELALYDRSEKNIYNKEQLSRSVSYYSTIRPNNYNKEETARVEAAAAKEARKAARQQKAKPSEE